MAIGSLRKSGIVQETLSDHDAIQKDIEESANETRSMPDDTLMSE